MSDLFSQLIELLFMASFIGVVFGLILALFRRTL
jgi:hypothetical protein